jgi:predicted dehydrogenase
MTRLRLAIIGCGAVTEFFHLPASKLTDKVEVVLLADAAPARAEQLARRFAIPRITSDYREALGQADAALVAVPNALHAPVAVELLRQGLHVLVEKPMALTPDECDRIIEAAVERRARLGVGLVRRFYAATRYVKQIVESGLLGAVVEFDLREGGVFKWAAASPSLFKRETAGGGVLADIGAHALDLLLWWLGDYESFEYYDDAMGGIEADCELHLRMRNGATGVVELSRTRDLRNTYIIRGEKGSVELECEYDPQVHLSMNGRGLALTGRVGSRDAHPVEVRNGWPVLDAFRAQFDDFAAAVLAGREPFVTGYEGRRAVELISACYAAKRPLQLAWAS